VLDITFLQPICYSLVPSTSVLQLALNRDRPALRYEFWWRSRVELARVYVGRDQPSQHGRVAMGRD
jgi:hypothetical protein